MATPARRFQMVARLDQLEPLRRLVRENAQALGFSEPQAFACELAADEAFTNIVQHGYGGESDSPVVVRFRPGRDRLLISFVDLGRAWDPHPLPSPQRGSSADQLDVGGLGRLIIERSMDLVVYRRRGSHNYLMLCKFKNPVGAARS
jgi:anti-sigma regulatory factor (Ser/Thr protein kinase)